MKTDTDISPRMTLLLATACGMIVANLYYAQTLVAPIARATGLPPELAGLIVTLTQVGYALGLLFLVPLGDLLENRRLVVTALVFSALALLAASLSTNGAVFLAAALAIGLSSVAAQVLVPFAAHLSKEATRGATVGKVVSGLLLGIMLARPVASLVADHANWHVVFGGAAALMAVLAFVLFKNLPQRHPQAPLPYPELIGSLWPLVLRTPVLRRRALYQAGLFGSFSLFWTVVPQELTSVEFGLSQTGVAIFALVGMAGAIASPVAGRLADSGHTLFATAAALVLGIVGYALPLFSTSSHTLALAILVAASIILDMAVAASLVLGQRAIFALAADIRSRLNGLFFALTFAGGALGSALGGWMYASHGWHAALLTGMAFVVVAFAGWLVEYAGHAAAGRSVKPQ
ncbi:MAG: MFS transporter [Pseudomonadota bacterium]|nr:MFS transporter [Pseudomonadota bacterium]